MRIFFVSLIFCIAWSLAPKAEELIVDMLEFAPVIVSDHPSRGFIGQLAIDAIESSGYKTKIVFMPARRAIATAPLEKNTLLVGLARVTDREPNFTWIAPLFKVDRAFFTMGKAVDSFNKAKEAYKTVAVTRGSAGAAILKEQGFSEKQIIEVAAIESSPAMVLAGHAEAWFSGVAEANVVLKNIDPKKLIHKGKTAIVSTHYLACSKNCDSNIIQKIKQSLRRMQTDGRVKNAIAICKKYEGIEVVKDFED